MYGLLYECKFLTIEETKKKKKKKKKSLFSETANFIELKLHINIHWMGPNYKAYVFIVDQKCKMVLREN